MNIKSLLLGSAAALAAVSGAQAADAIVAAEPEPMEYVRVCDAFGTGYFYIPGTETCLKIGGYIRFQTDFARSANGGNLGDWDSWTRGRLAVTSKSDTELGELTGFMAIHGEASRDNLGGTPDPFLFDEIYLQLGGFKAGTYLNWWDKGINGESDSLGSNRFSAISYTYTGEAFSAGIQVDEISRADAVLVAPAVVDYSGDGQGVGVEGIVTAKFGGVSFDLLGSYDVDGEEGAIRALMSAAVGPGTLQAAVVYATGESNVYFNASEWTVAASYALAVTEKLKITPGGQYYFNSNTTGAGDFQGEDYWRAGVTLDYQIVSGLAAKVSVQYQDSHDAVDDAVLGFVRLQRDF